MSAIDNVCAGGRTCAGLAASLIRGHLLGLHLRLAASLIERIVCDMKHRIRMLNFGPFIRTALTTSC
jgi:hypothetical protein